MTFCQTFLQNVSSQNGALPTNPIFTSDGNPPTNTNGISFKSTNLGIYDYYLLKKSSIWPSSVAASQEVANP
jgi:hypothetical protein